MGKYSLKVKIVTLIFAITTGFAQTHIEEIETIKDHKVTDLLSDLNPTNSLIFVDVDDVLFHSRDAALQKKRFSELIQTLNSRVSPKDMTEILPLITRSAEKEVVELDMISFIKNVQSKSIPIFALTQCTSDEEVRNERYSKLNNLGIDFTSSLTETQYHELDIPDEELKLKPFQTHTTKPIYDSGIIYCGSAAKGLVLSKFLEFIHAKTSELQVVFIDDNKSNLDDVKKTCLDLGINNFLGLHYTAIEKINKPIDDPQVLQYQLAVLLEDHKWQSDATAKFALAITSKLAVAFNL
ncbi:MAG: DUF2608 domain-containing protein [Alphaproteobacteria bacterium]|nr:DUF2608 domain-containing protein [Alphaproteobacteria bacterium]